MDRSDDVNNCRSEATLVFAMMPDFIHIGQGVGREYCSCQCADHRCSSLKSAFHSRVRDAHYGSSPGFRTRDRRDGIETVSRQLQCDEVKEELILMDNQY